MIVGVGIDVVDIARFGETLARTPALRERLFTETERAMALPSLAARFAAKEALAKALGSPVGLRWVDVTVLRAADGRPEFDISGGVLETVTRMGIQTLHVSLSHDAGVASAVVIAEGER
jgi:holo-[acyl-carrier protein] synthase